MKHLHSAQPMLHCSPAFARSPKGFTLIEILVVLAIFSAVLIGLSQVTDQYTTSTRNMIVGQQTKTFGKALQKYIADHQPEIAVRATATTPALISLATLQTAGYLPGGFATTNGYGQSICALVLQSAATQLNAIVITEGGNPINDFDLGDIASSIGAAGGGLYTANPSTLVGAVASWRFSAGNYANANDAGQHCDGTPGSITFAAGHPVMALWFTDFDNTSGVLYRAKVPGQPALNQMTTPIVMSSLQTAGTACTDTGAIAQNANQTALVVCGVNLLWNVVGNTVPGIANGAACTTAGQLGSDANNVAYTCNGFFWSPVSTISVNYSTSTPTGCPINNQIANSINTQEMLVCRNNFWVRLANLVPANSQLQTGQIVVSSGTFVAAPLCDWGGKVWYSFETINVGVDISVTPPRETLKLRAIATTTPSAGWNIAVELTDTASTTVDAAYLNLQQIFHYGCSY